MSSRADAPSPLSNVRFWVFSVCVSLCVALLAVWIFVVRPAKNDDGVIDPSQLVQPTDYTVAKVGDNVPIVDLENFDGQTFSTESLIGKPTVINFWASTCVPCVTEMPMLESIYQELGTEVNFLGIDVYEAKALGEKMIEQTGVTYPQAIDPTNEVLGMFGATALPHTVVLDAEGTIVSMKSLQLKDEAELREMIEEAQ